MEYIHHIIDFILHIDKHLVDIVSQYQTWTYLILFLIIFAETGLVVTPFLPGDSLLFAVGALIAKGDTGLNIYEMTLILSIAAIIGNVSNYFLGSYFGPKVFRENNKILKLAYYEKARLFFEKYGAVAIVLSRFMPILRTVAPFVAGVGKMNFGKFTVYNFIGGISWIVSFLFLGYFVGNFPWIKANFSLVVLIIMIVTVLPALFALFKKKK